MSPSDATTSVPPAELTDAGFVAPSEADILAGFQADINAALGGNANPALNTPQGQIAMSNTAVLGDALAAILAVFNGVDPARASGRMQDAIGRIYFMQRRPATPTTVLVSLSVNGTGTINAGTPIGVDRQGNTYAPLTPIVLTSTPTMTATLACTTPGAIALPADSLSLYQGGLGITALSNEEPGATGQDSEDRAAFEARRQASVAVNSIGQNASLLGALLALDGVSDAYVVDNPSAQANEIGGVMIQPHTLYAVIEGGTDSAIGLAILQHKSPGCATQGDQSVMVRDPNAAYGGAGPGYTFNFDRPQVKTLYVNVTLAPLTQTIPQNAPQQVKKAVVSFLSTGGNRTRLGGTVYASRLVCVINGLGDWAQVLDVTIGTDSSAGKTSVTLPINQLPVATEDSVTVSIGAS